MGLGPVAKCPGVSPLVGHCRNTALVPADVTTPARTPHATPRSVQGSVLVLPSSREALGEYATVLQPGVVGGERSKRRSRTPESPESSARSVAISSAQSMPRTRNSAVRCEVALISARVGQKPCQARSCDGTCQSLRRAFLRRGQTGRETQRPRWRRRWLAASGPCSLFLYAEVPDVLPHNG